MLFTTVPKLSRIIAFAVLVVTGKMVSIANEDMHMYIMMLLIVAAFGISAKKIFIFTIGLNIPPLIATIVASQRGVIENRIDPGRNREYLGYNWTSWLKTDVAYDFIKSPSTVHNRLLVSATATLKEGNFSFSLRERYLYDYKVAQRSGENVLRSKASINYHIKNTPLTPYVAIEMFTWDHWKKTRHYAGTHIKLDKHSTLDFFYMYYTMSDKNFQRHLLGLGYILKL